MPLPADPNIPEFPYRVGFTTKTKTHNPPPPFGVHCYGREGGRYVPPEKLHSSSQSELVFEYYPQETPDPPRVQHAELKITGPVLNKRKKGAQVAVCKITPKNTDGEPFLAVAKIYDPLYYPFYSTFFRRPVDIVLDFQPPHHRQHSSARAAARPLGADGVPRGGRQPARPTSA